MMSFGNISHGGGWHWADDARLWDLSACKNVSASGFNKGLDKLDNRVYNSSRGLYGEN